MDGGPCSIPLKMWSRFTCEMRLVMCLAIGISGQPPHRMTKSRGSRQPIYISLPLLNSAQPRKLPVPYHLCVTWVKRNDR